MTDIEEFAQEWALGAQFAHEVNDVLNEEYGGDVTAPAWFDYCRQMDEWAAATAS